MFCFEKSYNFIEPPPAAAAANRNNKKNRRRFYDSTIRFIRSTRNRAKNQKTRLLLKQRNWPCVRVDVETERET